MPFACVVFVCQDEGRMIYAGQDDWAHINCALWSAETYELDDGTLRNVHAAIIRGRKLVCVLFITETDAW